ncbi:MAG TPA: S-layer homology domain-containing protein [Firmicutes bacterium]|nr:S-layer homology domain-containing protein [Bacillota bacterium]
MRLFAKHGPGRRTVAALLALVMVVGLVPMTAPQSQAASVLQPYLDKLVEWGVMKGDANGNLDPNRAITRAEYVAMTNRAFGYDEVGPIPFSDVSDRAWYAEDIAIGYNAGYFQGTSGNTASPSDTLTREQAAVMLGRNLLMQAQTGENTDFSDSRSMSEWSRGIVGSLVDSGIVKGYTDGTFKPKNNITRGEVASLLVNAIGTRYSEAGEYSPGYIYGNLTITASGTTLRNTTIAGDLYITGGVGLGYVTLENVTVLGEIVVCGAGESNQGESSVLLRNVTAPELVLDSLSRQFVTLRADGNTVIDKTSVRVSTYLEDTTEEGYGLKYIEMDAQEGDALELAGNIKEVVNLTPGAAITMGRGVAQKITMDEKGTGSTLTIDIGSEVSELNLDRGTTVSGEGDIKDLNVNAPGSKVDMLPDNIVIRPGIDADIDGGKMDSVTASESSQDPRLLSGYPTVKDVAPTSATALFSTNKQGTIYWAVSAITDGSVEEDDLISPPAYGSNILKSGNIKATSSNQEYTAKITGLTSDGSYYLSAVLVDARGKHSPVKLDSFTTPDDTTPNFATGYPYMSLVTNTDAQVTVMTTKSCQLYYALLPKGAAAPTAADFKASAVTGNLGFGVRDAVKNTSQAINVNNVKLEELEDYDLYLWLNDYDGAKSSSVKKLSFTTVDKTPPQFVTELYMSDQKETSVGFTTSINEDGTVYWVVVKAGEAYPKPMAGQSTETGTLPLDSDAAKIQVSAGANALKSGRVNAKANQDAKFTVSGLEKETAYDLYYVAMDQAGNYSDTVKTLRFNTLDTNAPQAALEFTKYNGNETDKPLANTDIHIVFTEEVKTYPTGQTLTSLYDAVEAATGDAKETAKETMADTLESILDFYDLTGGDEELGVVRDENNEDTVNDQWLVDYRNAQIKDESGKTVIILPTTDDKNKDSALNLSSGSTYRIDVQGISDASGNAIGSMQLPDQRGFTTVFAQVNLKALNAPEIEEKQMDLAFSMTPISTSKVDDEIYWDMLLWSDTPIQFELYEKKPGGEWESQPLGSSEIKLASGGDEYVGTSYTYDVKLSKNFEQLKSLQENQEYQYGILVTELDGNSDHDTWNATLNMKIGLAAGANTNLSNLANNVSMDNWENMTQAAEVTSIGNCIAQGSDELTLKKVFSDKKAPVFASDFPKFTPTDTSVTMQVMLDRPGTVYYTVAPLGDVTTKLKEGGTEIKNSTDWEKYLPESGSDEKAPVYLSAPDDGDITNNRLGGGNPDIKWGKRDNVGASAVPLVVTELQPDTEYIVYFVLQGNNSNTYSETMGYRFKTEEVYRPVIQLSINNPSVNIKVDKDSDVDYILIPDDSIPNMLKEPFSKYANGEQGVDYSDPDFTVLDALMTDVPGQTGGSSKGSVFDWYATDPAKSDLAFLIRNENPGSTITAQGQESIRANETATVDFENDMKEVTWYTFLAVGNASGSSDAFRAARPVYLRDSDPPVVVACNSSMTQYEQTGYYNGTLSVTFSEGIYLIEREGGVGDLQQYKGVEAKGNDITPSDKEKFVTVKTVITGAPSGNFNVVTNIPGQAMTAVQFKLTNARIGDSFSFNPNLGDSVGNTWAKPLVLTLVSDGAGGAYFEITPSQWDGTGQ